MELEFNTIVMVLCIAIIYDVLKCYEHFNNKNEDTCYLSFDNTCKDALANKALQEVIKKNDDLLRGKFYRVGDSFYDYERRVGLNVVKTDLHLNNLCFWCFYNDKCNKHKSENVPLCSAEGRPDNTNVHFIVKFI